MEAEVSAHRPAPKVELQYAAVPKSVSSERVTPKHPHRVNKSGPSLVPVWLFKLQRESFAAGDPSTTLTHPQRTVGTGCVVQTHVKGLNP